MNLHITVQSVSRFAWTNNPRVEWSEVVHSWKAAWKLVDDSGAERSTCTKTEIAPSYWVLTIRGLG